MGRFMGRTPTVKATRTAAEDEQLAELSRALGPNPKSDELFDHLDKNKDNTIDRAEFKLVHAFTMQQAAKAERSHSRIKLLLWFFGIMFVLDAALSGVMFWLTMTAIEYTKEFHVDGVGGGFVDKTGSAIAAAKMTYGVGFFGLCDMTFDQLSNIDVLRFWAGDSPAIYSVGGLQIVDQREVRERWLVYGWRAHTPNPPRAPCTQLVMTSTAGATITLDCETKSGTLTTYDPLTFNASTVPTMPAHLNHSRRLKSLVSFPDSFRVVDARLEAERAAFHNSQSHHKR